MCSRSVPQIRSIGRDIAVSVCKREPCESRLSVFDRSDQSSISIFRPNSVYKTGSDVAVQFTHLLRSRETDETSWLSATRSALSHVRLLKGADLVAISQSIWRSNWRHPLLLSGVGEAVGLLAQSRRMSVSEIGRCLEAWERLHFLPSARVLKRITTELNRQLAISRWSPTTLVQIDSFLESSGGCFSDENSRSLREGVCLKIKKQIGDFGATELCRLTGSLRSLYHPLLIGEDSITPGDLYGNFLRSRQPPTPVLISFLRHMLRLNGQKTLPPLELVNKLYRPPSSPKEAVAISEIALQLKFADYGLIQKLSLWAEKNSTRFFYTDIERFLKSIVQLEAMSGSDMAGARLANIFLNQIRQKGRWTASGGLLLLRAMGSSDGLGKCADIDRTRIAKDIVWDLGRSKIPCDVLSPDVKSFWLTIPPVSSPSSRRPLLPRTTKMLTVRDLQKKRRLAVNACKSRRRATNGGSGRIGEDQMRDLLEMEAPTKSVVTATVAQRQTAFADNLKFKRDRQRQLVRKFRDNLSPLERKKLKNPKMENISSTRNPPDLSVLRGSVARKRQRKKELWKFEYLASKAGDWRILKRDRPEKNKYGILNIEDISNTFNILPKFPGQSKLVVALCKHAIWIYQNEKFGNRKKVSDMLRAAYENSALDLSKQAIDHLTRLGVLGEVINGVMLRSVARGSKGIVSVDVLGRLAELGLKEEKNVDIKSLALLVLLARPEKAEILAQFVSRYDAIDTDCVVDKCIALRVLTENRSIAERDLLISQEVVDKGVFDFQKLLSELRTRI